MKRIFNLKEKIISHVLSVENLTKSYYDVGFMKLFIFKKNQFKKLDYLYGKILNEKDKTSILRNYVFNSQNAVLDVFDHLEHRNEILRYFLDY